MLKTGFIKGCWVLLLLTLPIINLSAQIYSFEDGQIPSGWSTSGGGTLSVSELKSKLGNRSLRWDWVKGSTLVINNPSNLSAASISGSGGVAFFIYNTESINASLNFRFYNSTGVDKCGKTFKLGYAGWRTFWNCFRPDMRHDQTTLSQLRIKAPTTEESGTIYFDFLQFPSSVSWARMSDLQYTVYQSPLQENFLGMFNTSLSTEGVTPTAQEIAAVNQIEERVDQWFLGNGSYDSSAEVIARKRKINDWINSSKSRYPTLTRSEDGTIRGDGLFQMDYTSKVEGVQPVLFRNVSATHMIPLAYDYRMNGSSSSLSKLIDLYDWFNDQGWAAGSAIGSLYMEKLRSGGYFNSIFMARDGLDDTRYNREIETLRWFSLYGTTLDKNTPGETADNLRTLLMPKLYYSLMLRSDVERVAAMRAFRDYCIYAFSVVQGYTGTFKPDYLGYHHQGVYLGAYFPAALYVASQVAYFLRDTPFALPDSILLHLKESSLAFTRFCAEYDVPTASNGRFPGGTTIMDVQIFAMPFLAVAMGNDVELTAAVKRLWQPSSPLLKKVIERATMDITFTSTPGEIETLLSIASRPDVAPQTIGNVSHFYPYGGLQIFRSSQTHVALKGMSKYIWDYEGGGTTENPYGRYLSYGMLELNDLATGRKSPAIPTSSDTQLSALFDWNRLSGATTKELSDNDLNYTIGGANKHRNFTDQSMLGGANLCDTIGTFALALHDATFDPSFRVNQSVTRFGDKYICLGSGITNQDSQNPTVTTLFQNEVVSGESIRINDAVVSADQTQVVNPVVVDNLSTAYVVMNGAVDVRTQSANGRTLTSSVIRHGMAPSGKSYAYVMMPRCADDTLARWREESTRPITIRQQDQYAHIVTQKDLSVTSYTIFDAGYQSTSEFVAQVNTPSIVMVKDLGDHQFQMVLTDPDLRRGTAANIDALTDAIKQQPSADFSYRIKLNQLFSSAELPEGFSIRYEGETTILEGTVREGRSYSITLRQSPGWAEQTDAAASIRCVVNRGEVTLSRSVDLPFDVFFYSVDGRLISAYPGKSGCFTFRPAVPAGSYIVAVRSGSDHLLRQLVLLNEC